MRYVDVPQGGEEWHKLHTGRLTSSRFKTVMNGGPNAWHNLMHRMRPTARRGPDVKAPSLDWGYEHEPVIRDLYAKQRGVQVGTIGFIIGDDERFGVSPDGLVGKNGCIEIKCPFVRAKHAQTVVLGRMPIEHRPQVQGILWVAQLEWCDFISYDPRAAGPGGRFVVRVERDDQYIRRLSERCDQFFDLYEKKHKTSRRPVMELF
jgi:hypothetical protein